MGYCDGNTVTVLQNYVQHFAMNDDSFGTTFGNRSISGNTHGANPLNQHDEAGNP